MSVKTTVLGTTMALAVSGAAAHAGGFERGGHSVSVLFEKGNYAEFSFGAVSPDVSGNLGIPTGDVAADYLSFGAAYKRDLTDQLSVALIFDQPWGASVKYPAALGGGYAYLRSSSLTLAGRYKTSENFSLHAGLRYVTVDGNLFVPNVAVPALTVLPQSFQSDSDLGYMIGAAYEIPDIALRVALTYFSETEHNLASSLGTTGTINPPQSVNLDFQTGIAADTLLFGQIRWADWTSTQVNVPPAVAPTSLIDYEDDVITYSLGIGRKFSEQWSGAVTFGYEKAEGTQASTLAPTDGYASIGIGGTYTMDNMKVTAGIRYVDLGDASVAPGGGNEFTGNSAIGVGIKVGYSF